MTLQQLAGALLKQTLFVLRRIVEINYDTRAMEWHCDALLHI